MTRRRRGSDAEESTGREERVILALLTAASVEEAARKAGLDARTLRRWLKKPAFRERYLAARREFFDQAFAQLEGAMGEAVAVLRKQLKSRKNGDKLRAALAILDRAIRVQEQDLLEALELLNHPSQKEESRRAGAERDP